MTHTEVAIDRVKRGLPIEEIERRKTALRDYVFSHPDLTKQDMFYNPPIVKLLYVYNGKVEKALYDVIVGGLNPRNIPPEHFRPLVSYIASKIEMFFQGSGLPNPSIEDMKQDGIVGILKAQDRFKQEHISNQRLIYFRHKLVREIWRGLETYFNLPHSNVVLQKLVFLCRYDFSVQEAKEINGDEFFGDIADKTINSQLKLLKGRNLGFRALLHMPYEPEQECEQDLSIICQDLNSFTSILSVRDKEILLSRLNGKTLEEVGHEQIIPVTKQRVKQIEEKSINKLRERARHLPARESSLVIRLYDAYLEGK